MDSICVGSTFWFDSGKGRHLYVIIAKQSEPPECWAVNITSSKKWHQPAIENPRKGVVIIKPDEYPVYGFVAYEYVEHFSSSKLENLAKYIEQKNKDKKQEPIPSEVLRRIIDGAIHHALVPEKLKSILRNPKV